MNTTTMIKQAPLRVGVIYTNTNGERYECIRYTYGNGYVIRQLSSNWVCTVRGVTRYENGKIDWLYSTGGHFLEETE